MGIPPMSPADIDKWRNRAEINYLQDAGDRGDSVSFQGGGKAVPWKARDFQAEPRSGLLEYRWFRFTLCKGRQKTSRGIV
ncbi:hypothetical protein JZ751_018998 [Albula glossodonta]|uniref:Uncharacterized protein n=1 Tax=Albula glossodonta TaxID=121402 RepID=A0A8T2NL50_9TELE|nr:hypothetical protein JZ751_018998 [Albula glossodonta]